MGGFSRIDQVTRFSPRCLLPGVYPPACYRRRRSRSSSRQRCAAALVVSDERVRRAARAGEGFVALRPAAIGVEVLNRRRTVENGGVLGIKSGVSARNGEMSSMIQMPRPCVASTRSDSRGCTTMSRTATAGKSLPLYCAHCPPPSTEIHKPNSVPRKSRRWIDGVFRDDVRVATTPLSFEVQRSPGLAVVRRLVRVRGHVAEGVAIEGSVGRAFVEAAGRQRGNPRILGRGPERCRRRWSMSCAPSRVICTLPSSVPTQMIWPFFGDSRNGDRWRCAFPRRSCPR